MKSSQPGSSPDPPLGLEEARWRSRFPPPHPPSPTEARWTSAGPLPAPRHTEGGVPGSWKGRAAAKGPRMTNQRSHETKSNQTKPTPTLASAAAAQSPLPANAAHQAADSLNKVKHPPSHPCSFEGLHILGAPGRTSTIASFTLKSAGQAPARLAPLHSALLRCAQAFRGFWNTSRCMGVKMPFSPPSISA